ncbi:hypothetical protein ACFL0I_05345 [Gemmatimonadota bacterium]
MARITVTDHGRIYGERVDEPVLAITTNAGAEFEFTVRSLVKPGATFACGSLREVELVVDDELTGRRAVISPTFGAQRGGEWVLNIREITFNRR